MATAIDFIFNVRDSLSPVLDRINQKQKKLAYDIAYMQNKTVGGWSRLAQEQEKFKKRTDVSANSISDLRTKIEQLTRTRDLSVSYQQIREANEEISKLQHQLQRLENLPPKGFMSNLSSTGKLLIGAFGAFALNAIRSYITEFISSSITLSNQMKAIDGAIRFAAVDRLQISIASV